MFFKLSRHGVLLEFFDLIVGDTPEVVEEAIHVCLAEFLKVGVDIAGFRRGMFFSTVPDKGRIPKEP